MWREKIVWSTAYSIFVPCGLKIGDATSLKMYYVLSQKTWNYERALKRRLVAGIILLGTSECQETKIHKTWSFCQPQKALRQSHRHLKLSNFTLPVFKLRNTHHPFIEVTAFLCQSFSGSTWLSLIALQLPSFLWSPFMAVHDVICMKQSDWSTTITVLGTKIEKAVDRTIFPSAYEK